MIVDLILVLLLLVAIGVALHYRAKAAASTSASASALAGVSTSLSAELEQLRGDVRAMVDSKFKSLSQWLLSELPKIIPQSALVDTVTTDPAQPADGVAPPTAAPAASGNDAVAAKIAEIDANAKALAEHRAKLVAAREQLAALL
jgi:hypothetical protein